MYRRAASAAAVMQCRESGTDHGVVDMALEDIVDGRCGAKAIGRRDDLRDFYEELHKSLGRMRSTCSRP
jgi:hypothetical protein